MKQVEEQRTKIFQSEVKNTGIVINYRATLVPAEAGEEVTNVYGTIVKENKNVGSVSYDKAADRMHTSFEPFSATTAAERKSVSSVAASDVAEIIANK
ncbi:hypothetical protein DXA84_07720 [Phocaeicola vulgatus]|jgi:hypothetical protein|uniref:hypothetical protein n=1 Tax=Phocaeicola vulgatus TaxID=821 RepID=UPI000E42F0D7|nr:hypothetical protein [Phocaeicola vulgatus]RGO88283.1 hypothetical protein DXA84_07720 [Phocaeicola vulgatus]RGO95210.1 hypothetical protein DXA82_06920 [Phocaeicola vulgatus]DAZ47552.1 MAG TPA: hypothetical protein [Caudoviricetes sp.]